MSAKVVCKPTNCPRFSRPTVKANIDRLAFWRQGPPLVAARCLALDRQRRGQLDGLARYHCGADRSQDQLRAAVADVKKENFTDILLLGMGGSSLCPEVLKKTFGKIAGFPNCTCSIPLIPRRSRHSRTK